MLFRSDGRKILDTRGVSRNRYAYNENGELELIVNYDMDGIVLCADGYAAIYMEYDAQGNREFITYLDLDGVPVTSAVGFAIAEAKLDGAGGVIGYEMYDAKDDPVDTGGLLNPVYDITGNVTGWLPAG